MSFIETPIKGLVVFQPRVFEDDRGYFFESFNANSFKEAGIHNNFVQDNQSKSSFGVLRGLHYQVGEFAQAKLVRVLSGKVLDVAVDIRNDSPTYGQSYSIVLSEENKTQLFVPRGFAHGFVVLSKEAVFYYKVDNFYSKESEGAISWNDPKLNIDWQIADNEAILSEKDGKAPAFGEHRNSLIDYNI